MSIQGAQIVVPCSQFDATFAALTEQLGFRVDSIFPADAPTTAVVSGFGVTLRLEARSSAHGSTRAALLLVTDRPPLMVHVPDVMIEWLQSGAPIEIPEAKQEFIITRMCDDNGWGTGRAGMQYRDLIPRRVGGRFVASHIRIPTGGPVPDYVHFHRVRFQMIFCKAGWVRVVYADQGEPFVMHAGDCVLQPPGIRHRVLEASAGLEVIELGCPAVHETVADHLLVLPSVSASPQREFSGQRFVRHIAADARWKPWRWLDTQTAGFEARDSGIGLATSSLAGARVVRAQASAAAAPASHRGELLFLFVLAGALQLSSASHGDHTLMAGDCVTIPSGSELSLRAAAQVEFLEIALPAS